MRASNERPRRFLTAFRALAALTIAFASGSLHAAQGLVVMQVSGAELNNVGEPIGGLGIYTFTLLNIETKKSTMYPANRVAVAETDEGIYCLLSVEPYLNLRVQYCGEPYFRVVAGKVNNAGRWRFGVSFAGGGTKLLSSVEKLPETLAEAVTYDKPLLEKYGYVGAP